MIKEKDPHPSKPASNSWILFSILCFSYILSYFYRISIAVVAPNLMDAFGISASGLGLLGSIFSYTFGFTQIPLMTQNKELFPMSMVGTALTGVNFLRFMGFALFQQVMGYFIRTISQGGRGLPPQGLSVGLSFLCD